MTGADIPEILAYLAGSYFVGWCVGALFLMIKKTTEQI